MSALLHCAQCGLDQRTDETVPGARRCARCKSRLPGVGRRSRFGSALAWSLTALIAFALANVFPFLTLEVEGRSQEAALWSGAVEFAQRGMIPLALLVGFVVILAPAATIALQVWLAWSALGRAPPRKRTAAALRAYAWLREWSMMEVFFLGVLVAYVKLIDLAEIEIGVAAFCFVGVVFAAIFADLALDRDRLWRAIEPQRAADALAGETATIACPHCHQVSPGGARALCSRCARPKTWRRERALQRSWALSLAAAALFLPANLLPILTVISLGREEHSTIVGGVVLLAEAGHWPLALVVFVASVVVPLAKLGCLFYLLSTVHLGARVALKARTKLYHFTEAIGRWSMIDVFMIGVLISLVKLGALSTIEAGPAASAFAGVVVLTMLAAQEFDPRLMWDRAGCNERS